MSVVGTGEQTDEYTVSVSNGAFLSTEYRPAHRLPADEGRTDFLGPTRMGLNVVPCRLLSHADSRNESSITSHEARCKRRTYPVAVSAVAVTYSMVTLTLERALSCGLGEDSIGLSNAVPAANQDKLQDRNDRPWRCQGERLAG